MTFKSQHEPEETHQHHLQPNGQGLERRGNTVGNSTNFGERATQRTLQQMTNPFLSRAFNNVDSSAQSNLYSYNPSVYQNQVNPLKSDLYSPSAGMDEDSSNLVPMHQESQGDPSSSSMSGYDLKGMMMKHNNAQIQMHQQQTAPAMRPMSAHHKPAKSYGIAPNQVPHHHVLSQQTHNGATSDNTSNPYMPHVVSQSYNPLKTTLGNPDEQDTPESSMLASVEQHEDPSKKPDLRPTHTATTLSQDDVSDESEDIEAQYELMQQQMQHIRQQHNLGAGKYHIQHQLQGTPGTNVQQTSEEESSDLSSDGDVQDGESSGIDSSSLSQSMQSEQAYRNQMAAQGAPFGHPKYRAMVQHQQQ